jgi:hypothetical protein
MQCLRIGRGVSYVQDVKGGMMITFEAEPAPKGLCVTTVTRMPKTR